MAGTRVDAGLGNATLTTPIGQDLLHRNRTILFHSGGSAATADLPPNGDLRAALHDLALDPPRPVLVLVGGADGLGGTAARRLEILFRDTVVPLLERLGAALIDGGTDTGVMALMGRARARANARFPLLGVAARGTVRLPSEEAEDRDGRAPLEPHHSHFLFVPGDAWGDEAPWISAAAGVLADGAGSATLVAGGGDITRLDVEISLRAGRNAIVLAGSGGTADRLAALPHAGDLGEIGIEPERANLMRVLDLAIAGSALPGILKSLL